LDIVSLAVSGYKIFAGTYGTGFYVSLDNGTSWISISEGLPSNTLVYDIAISVTDIYAGTWNSSVWKRSLSDLFMGDEENLLQSAFSVYPNPSDNHFVIKLALGDSEGYQVKIFDMMGKQIEELVITNGQYSVQWSPDNVSPGMYIIRVNNKWTKEISGAQKVIYSK
jgi:hypothetical protein